MSSYLYKSNLFINRGENNLSVCGGIDMPYITKDDLVEKKKTKDKVIYKQSYERLYIVNR